MRLFWFIFWKGEGTDKKKLDTEIRRKTSPYLRIVAVIVTHSKQTPTSHSIHTHHEVSRQQFLEKLCLFVLDSLDDKLIITGDVEEGTAGSGVRQLDQRLITQRILPERDRWTRINIKSKKTKQILCFWSKIYGSLAPDCTIDRFKLQRHDYQYF